MVADCQSTNMQNFTKNIHRFKIHKFKSKDFQILCGVAGISIGYEFLLTPFFKYVQDQINQLKIDISDLDVFDLMELLNSLSARYFETAKLSGLQMELLNGVGSIVTIKTKRLIGCFSSSGPISFSIPNLLDQPLQESDFSMRYEGFDSLSNTNKKQKELTSNTAHLSKFIFNNVGSGSLYVLGAIIAQDHVNPWADKSEHQALSWFSKNFKNIIVADLASDSKKVLTVGTIYYNLNKSATIRALKVRD